MKKKIGFIATLVMMLYLMVCMGMSASAAEVIETGECGAQGDNVIYTLYDDGVLVISGQGDMVDYETNAYNFHNLDFERVVIEYGVTSIGKDAFSYCSNIVDVSIAESVTSIGVRAFEVCRNLETIILPESVTNIGERAFEFCESLTDISIPNGVTKISDYMFAYNEKLENIVIPDSVTDIGGHAFYYCTSLKNVTLPNGVISVGEGAFYFCNSIVDIRIPKSVTNIGKEAFGFCKKLTSIIVDEDNSYYNDVDGVLFNKTNTELIQYPVGNTSRSYVIPDTTINIGCNAFYQADNLKAVTIPNSVLTIGDNAFSYCNLLENIAVPNSVTNIGDSVFLGCDNLRNVTLSESMISISNSAFRHCDGLIEIVIPDSVTSIGEEAFYHCSKLTNITILGELTDIGDKAFVDCDSLENLYYCGSSEQWKSIAEIEFQESCPNAVVHFAVEKGSCGDKGDNVTYILYDNGKLVISGTGKMYDYDNFTDFSPFYKKDIKTIVIEKGVTTVGDGMFEQCDSLVEVTIPDGVTRIGDSAFYSCSSLPNVTIPYGVKIIGDNAFSDCSKFTAITIPDSVTSIGISAFSCCEKITSIVIPDSVVNLGRGAFDRCSAATSITIGKSVRSIGISTFNDCDKIESIYIPASVTNIESSAFSDWHSLKRIEVDENNENYISEQGILFNKDKTQLVKYPSSKEGTIYTVPESVESFGEYEVFGHCKYLEEIIIGSRVTALGDFIFQDCKNLKKVEILGELITVDLAAFWGCNSLNDITLPDSVENIGSLAFSDCDSLTSINIPKSVMSIEKSAFNKCDTLKDIYYTDSEESWNEILIEEENDPLYTATIHYYANCKHTEDGYESVIIEENRIEPTYSESGSYDEVSVCGRCGVELNRETKEIPALWLSNINYSFDNGVLTVSGTGEIPGNLAKYPWYQHAEVTEIIKINGISSIGSNAFSEFRNVRILILNGGAIQIKNNAFIDCEALSIVVSFVDAIIDENAFIMNTNVFIEKSKTQSETRSVIKFDYIDGKLIFEGDIVLNGEDFLSVIAIMCGYYKGEITVATIKGSFTITDRHMFGYIDQYNNYTFTSKIENVDFKAAIGYGEPVVDRFETISFNVMYEKIINNEMENFYLVINDEAGNDYQEEEVGILKNIYQRVLKAFKALIDWLVKLFK